MVVTSAAVLDPHRVFVVGCQDALGGLEAAGLEVRAYPQLQAALSALERQSARVLVVHAQALGLAGVELVAHARRAAAYCDVILWAPAADAQSVRDALRSGVTDVVLDPDPGALVDAVRATVTGREVSPRSRRMRRVTFEPDFEGIVTRSPMMVAIFETCLQVAGTDATVLLLGETGTGKELLARAIHKHSGRAGRFVAINCGAVPETLIEAELFGHEKGSFTGAVASKPGLFRHADEGTLLLDEVGDLPPHAQHSLLRVLQEGTIRPVGGHEELPVDVRVLAATSAPLDRAVREGRFREDLLYRLDVIRIAIPPLRDRPEDILHLFGHFMRKLSQRHHLEPPRVGEGFVRALEAYPWPGNVRQLQNFAERLLITQHGGELDERHFHDLIRPYRDPAAAAAVGADAPPSTAAAAPRVERSPTEIDVSKTLDEHVGPVLLDLERRYFEAMLRENEGRVGVTARAAGLSRRTLLRKMKKYGIDRRQFR